VTPDAVIYRYLELIAPAQCDAQLLCQLLCCDADLLARWLKILDLPADLAQLRQQIAGLSDSQFQSVASAQGWSVLPIAGSARLSLDQWQFVLRAAFLAEVLAEHLVVRSAPNRDVLENIRLRALLAISGVQLEQDPKLAELIEFRGTAPELLEDAALELRIFAVIDAIEFGNEADLAHKLLEIDTSTFDSLLNTAATQAQAFVEKIGVDTTSSTDWSHRIWLRQQIGLVGAAFNVCESVDELTAMHDQVSRCLFALPPLLLKVNKNSNRIELVQAPQISIRIDSTISTIASVALTGQRAAISDGPGLAVVDRQLLRMLGAQEAFIVAAGPSEVHGVLVVSSDDDVDVNVAAELYAEELARHFTKQSKLSTAQDDEDERADSVQLFRDAENQRLREIVHEANNPLSIVHNYLHILELRMQHEPEAVQQLTMIATELRRAGDIFSRAREIPDQTEAVADTVLASEIELNTWLRNLGELHRGLAQEQGVDIQLVLLDAPLLTRIDQGKLAQIMTNLIKNALEACAPGDQVTLSCQRDVYRDGGFGFELTVQDTGPGLEQYVLENLAQAKQSSKGGEHQGVGLQLVVRLVDELGGALDVHTHLGAGTVFSLFFGRPVLNLDK